MMEKIKLWQALAILGVVVTIGIVLRIMEVPMYGLLFWKDLIG